LLVITSSWKKRVEKGNKGFENDHEYHDDTNVNAANDKTSNTNTKSTGKGGKKRRAKVVSEAEAEVDEDDEEDD